MALHRAQIPTESTPTYCRPTAVAGKTVDFTVQSVRASPRNTLGLGTQAPGLCRLDEWKLVGTMGRHCDVTMAAVLVGNWSGVSDLNSDDATAGRDRIPAARGVGCMALEPEALTHAAARQDSGALE